MKILLVAINSKYIHSNLAIYTLRANAGCFKDNIELCEYTINQRSDEILADIFKRKADVVCFSCYIWNISYVEEVAKEYRKICENSPVWVGGPEVSYETELFLEKHSYIDGIIVGEGENTFRDLCGHYVEGRTTKELINIPGLAYRNDEGKYVFTGYREHVNMTELEFAYDTTKDFSNRIIYYESSRGCPFSCSYCLSSVDKALRFRDTEIVKKELKFFIDQKVPQVKFVDRTFNCNHEHAKAIWQFLKENDNGVTNFHFEISADLLNEEELMLISTMRPGLIQLEIGVQSVNEVTIKEIHRTMKLEKVKEITGKIRSFQNVHQHLDLIAGLPYEDYESFGKSYDEIFALWPNQLQLGFLKVLKGSFMYERAKEYGIKYHDTPPYEVLCTNWITYEDVLNIKKVEEMTEVYYNSGQFEITMKLLAFRYKSMFEFFRRLGDYYETKGYSDVSHSRIRRYEILLDFLTEEQTFNIEMIKEALTFDLYYRENCKTRPEWATDPKSFREETYKYCKKGKLSHVEPFHYRFPEKHVYDLKELPLRLEKPVWILFDYENRDILDNQAMTTVYI